MKKQLTYISFFFITYNINAKYLKNEFKTKYSYFFLSVSGNIQQFQNRCTLLFKDIYIKNDI